MRPIFAFLALFLFAFTVFAGPPVDPADGPPVGPMRDPGLALAIAAAAGALIRSVIIPLLKSPIARGFFKNVPPFVQQLILVVLACIVGALDKLAMGGTMVEAVLAALAAYGTAAALYGLTAPVIEKRPGKNPPPATLT